MSEVYELQHWGIKGQKWGVRRYQNEDGSLTEEGKKHYMTAARKGKLNPKKLSDADLDMINKRFAKEDTYNKNVQKYVESTFSYKAKQALLERIKGNGGGGGKKGGGGGGIGKILSTPIKKAFEDAFKENGKGGSDDGGGKGSKDTTFEESYHRGQNFIAGNIKNKSIGDLVSNSRISTGKKYMGQTETRSHTTDTSWNTTRNTSAADVLRSRNQHYQERRAENDWKVTSNKRKKKMKHGDFTELEEEYLMHQDVLTRFVICRKGSDELMHYGITGQKWGVRRYQNEDGTLTAEGKSRYHSEKERDKLSNNVKKYIQSPTKKHMDKIVESPQIKQAINNIKGLAAKTSKAWDEAKKMEHDWYSGKNKDYEKYVRKAAEKSSKEYGDGTEEDIQSRLRLMKYDDLDQGDSFDLWLKDNPKAKQRNDDAYKRYSQAVTKHMEACKDYAAEWLGDHAGDRIKNPKTAQQTVSFDERLANIIYYNSQG